MKASLALVRRMSGPPAGTLSGNAACVIVSHCCGAVSVPRQHQASPEALISHEAVRALEAQIDNGPSVAALRRFNDNLRKLDADTWSAHPAAHGRMGLSSIHLL